MSLHHDSIITTLCCTIWSKHQNAVIALPYRLCRPELRTDNMFVWVILHINDIDSLCCHQGFLLTLGTVPFHKSKDALLHPGHNDQIHNTLFTELPHVTRRLRGGYDRQAQGTPSLIGKIWWTISASIRYPSHSVWSYRVHKYSLLMQSIKSGSFA